MSGGDEVVVAPEEPVQPLEWKFSQVFGERAAGEEVQEGNCLFHMLQCAFLMGTMLLDPLYCVWIRVWFLLVWIRFGSCLYKIMFFFFFLHC